MRKGLAVLALLASAGAQGQAIKPEPTFRSFTAEEIAKVPMPDLAFKEQPTDVADYEKYFFFHRDGTSFAEAYGDIRECDALASGISYHAGNAQVGYPYAGTIGGAIGGAIGNALADAIFGSAQRRKIRRINMRNCMGFKDYQRYGLAKDKWSVFNFEEGHGREEDESREAALLQQARVASGPKPAYKGLEP